MNSTVEMMNSGAAMVVLHVPLLQRRGTEARRRFGKAPRMDQHRSAYVPLHLMTLRQ